MKLATISDTHLLVDRPKARLDDAVNTSFEKMEFILDWCNDNRASLIVTGDLTDKPRSWHLLPRITDLFSDYPNVEKYAIFGQHDIYMYSEETKSATILGTLEKAGLVTILGSKEVVIDGINLYGCSYGQKIPEVEYKNEKSILVIHAPITEGKFGFDTIEAKDFLKENKDYDIILCGDIHREFFLYDKLNRTILNTGPMIRRTAEEYYFTFEPNFMVYDTKKDEFERIVIPHKPAEEVLSRDHLDNEIKKEELRSKFTDSLNKEIALDMSFTANLDLFLKEKKVNQNIREILAKEISLLGGK